MTLEFTLPKNPNSVVTADLNTQQGWTHYSLGDDVIDGDPNFQIKLLRTVGVSTHKNSVSFFTAEPSKFVWKFDHDESFVLLEGHISITMDSGEKYDIKPSQALSIPGGSNGVCEVFVASKKFTVVTSGNG